MYKNWMDDFKQWRKRHVFVFPLTFSKRHWNSRASPGTIQTATFWWLTAKANPTKCKHFTTARHQNKVLPKTLKKTPGTADIVPHMAHKLTKRSQRLTAIFSLLLSFSCLCAVCSSYHKGETKNWGYLQDSMKNLKRVSKNLKTLIRTLPKMPIVPSWWRRLSLVRIGCRTKWCKRRHLVRKTT